MSAEESKNNEEILNEEVTNETAAEQEGQEETIAQEETTVEDASPEAVILKMEQELAASKDALLRKAAELENVRKRVQRERIALFEDAKVAALQEFLPISEDLNRVLDAAATFEVDPGFMDGVKLVAGKFEEAFSKYGVETINATGIPFDVDVHDAMLRQPAPDENTESNTVLQVLEAGYKIGNKVIKHAKVIVSE